MRPLVGSALAFSFAHRGWRLVELQLYIHEVEQLVPAFKIQIVGQGAQVVEESFADAQVCAQALINVVTQIENGVHQKGQQVE